jgi:tetratricopeptide (TPR) repeat protein
MPFKTLAYLTLVFAFSVSLSAQSRGGGKPPSTGNAPGSTPTSTPTPENVPGSIPTSTPTPGLSSPDLQRSFFLLGKVTVDDGTALTEPVAVQSNCRGRIRTEGYTDSKGHFSLEINSLKEKQMAGVDQAIDSSPATFNTQMTGGNSSGDLLREWRECELQAVLPGFTSQVVELASRLTDFSTTDVGTISLHRLAQVEGFTISATSANAPPKAKKEFDKARELEKKEKWDEALERFHKAVELYPKYATAWLEMGRVQVKMGDLTAARQSFQQALAADPKFVSPYEELIQLAMKDKQWPQVVNLTGELLKLNPVSFPQYWYCNSAANLYLERLDAAEKSAVRGLEVDSQHRFPRLEYLLGVILAQKHDYPGAVEHIRNYLRLAPHAADADVAERQVQEFEKLSSAATIDK